MMSPPVAESGILDMRPYTPGKSPVPEPGRKVFKLSANRPYGPSPKAIAVYKQAAAQLGGLTRKATSRVLRELKKKNRRPSAGLEPDAHHRRRVADEYSQTAGAHLSWPRRLAIAPRTPRFLSIDRDNG